jgi:hypothetical protein
MVSGRGGYRLGVRVETELGTVGTRIGAGGGEMMRGVTVGVAGGERMRGGSAVGMRRTGGRVGGKGMIMMMMTMTVMMRIGNGDGGGKSHTTGEWGGRTPGDE